MIIDIECPLCRGEGTSGICDDPTDMDCPRCDGAGVIPHDLNEDIDDD